MDEIYIRAYKKDNRYQIRQICYDTAFMGESGEFFFDDKEILADAVTLYYSDYEPESIFIAEYSGNIIAYLTGCRDTVQYYRIWRTKILPLIITKAMLRGVVFNIKTLRFLYNSLISWIRRDFKRPDVYKKYPAHFHINIVKDYRGRGIGSRLVDDFLGYLNKRNIKGVHVVTISKKAKEFFEKVGFNLIYSQRVSVLSYLLRGDILLYILAKEV